MNTISVLSQFKKYSALEKNVVSVAVRALKFLKKEKTHTEFFLIADTEIRKINKIYRHKDAPTNVLSFCEPKKFVRGNKKELFLGEIYLAPDYIKRHKQSVEHMVVHGLLHVCGYDHMSKKDAEKMEKKETEIFKSL